MSDESSESFNSAPAPPGEPAADRPVTTRAASAAPGRLDAFVPWTLAAVLGFVFLQLSWLRWTSLNRSVDLGYFRQAEWLITNWETPFITTRGLNLLADHFSPIMYPISGASWLLPGDSGLLVLQSAALGLAVVPLWRLARGPGRLDVRGASLVVALYALAPVVHNLALSGFHPEVVVLPVIVWAVLFALERSWVGLSVSVGLILLAKEDLAILVVGLGLMLLARKETRAGWVTIGVGTAWFALATGVVMPWIGGGELEQTQRYSQYGDTTREVVGFLVTHPWRIVGDLATSQNLELLVALLVPVAFVPLLSWRILIAVVPYELALLLTNQDLAHTIEAHYTVAAAAIVYAATAVGMRRLAGERPRVPITALLLVVAGASLLVWSNAAPSQDPLAWDDPDPIDDARREALELVPDNAAVAVTAELAEAASQRKLAYNFPQPFDYWEEPSNTGITVQERRDQIDWVVVDTNAAWTWPRAREVWLDEWLPDRGFEQVFEREGVVVFNR